MITYRLTELLSFWDRIDTSDFGEIQRVLKIIYSDSVPNEKKIDCILKLLRFYGLNEHTGGEDDDYLSEPKMFQSSINPIQLFDIHFDNGKIDFWQNLN